MLQYIFNMLSAPEYLNTVYVRCFMAFFVALILALAYGDRMIKVLHAHQKKGQPIREDGPKSHLKTKKGTPTMGGILILGSALIAILLCADLANPLVWIAMMVLVVYGLVGAADDYTKVTKNTANAMSAKMKLFLQFTTALIAVLVISYEMPQDTRFVLTFPYFINLSINLLWFYVPFAMVVIAGASNAVNLSDGLDGLAVGLMIIALPVFMVIAYICGSELVNDVYMLPVPRAAEVAVTCAAVIGGCVGFLWFNAAPAKVFMGDTGSLALGGALAALALLTGTEFLLVLVGGIFVIEALSVIMQVSYFKLTHGKRIFKMSPIHHHFELSGLHEVQVTARFTIISVILALLGVLYCLGGL